MYDPKLNATRAEPWFTKSIKQILIEHMGIVEPSDELVKWVESALDNSKSYDIDLGQDIILLEQVKKDIHQKIPYKNWINMDWTKFCRLTQRVHESVWDFIYGFTGQEIMFIANNFAGVIQYDKKNWYQEFFEKTKSLPNQKEIAQKYLEVNDLDAAILACKKESFDLSLLDFLDGKIDSPKMLNWGVGQVMKQYPKKFSPAEVKSALEERFKF